MIIRKYLIGARVLDFTTPDGNNINGTQLFVCDIEQKNSNDGRIPEKCFISGNTSVFKELEKGLNKADRDLLIPIELEVTLNGKNVRYLNAKLI